MLARIIAAISVFGLWPPESEAAVLAADGLARFQDYLLHASEMLPPHLRDFWIFYAGAAGFAVLFLMVWVMRPRRPAVPEQAKELDPAVAELERIYMRYSESDTQGRHVAASLKGSETGGHRDGSATPTFGWLERLDERGDRFAIRGSPVRIGRHSTNDIILSDVSVHRYHGVLALNEGRKIELMDLGGANGCIVNGIRYQKRVLENGDVVELGEVRLKYHAASRA